MYRAMKLGAFLLLALLGWLLISRAIADWATATPPPICTARNVDASFVSLCAGFSAMSQGNHPAAFSEFLKAATPVASRTPSGLAQYQVAFFYKNGIGGVPVNVESAKEWLSRSSAAGDKHARKLTHLAGIPMLFLWSPFFTITGYFLIALGTAGASRIPEPNRKHSIITAYLMMYGIASLVTCLLTKETFFWGAAVLSEFTMIAAATFIGCALINLATQCSEVATRARLLLLEQKNPQTSSYRRVVVEEELNDLLGRTAQERLSKCIENPSLLLLDGDSDIEVKRRK